RRRQRRGGEVVAADGSFELPAQTEGNGPDEDEVEKSGTPPSPGRDPAPGPYGRTRPSDADRRSGRRTRDGCTSHTTTPPPAAPHRRAHCVMLPLTSRFCDLPAPHGLYHPASEVDSCGVAMIATLREGDHRVVEHALTALRNLEHRGAVGAEEDTGDGTGIIVQLPDAFLRAVSGIDLPPRGAYAAGTAFVPRDRAGREQVLAALARIAEQEG